jgi:hypothetical protein
MARMRFLGMNSEMFRMPRLPASTRVNLSEQNRWQRYPCGTKRNRESSGSHINWL